MILCFPMAGSGRRFREDGYTLPKPLISVGGKPLIQWAWESYRHLNATPIYIPRAQDMANGLAPYLRGGIVYPLDMPTVGPLQSILATQLEFAEEELLIADCDSLLKPSELDNALQTFRDRQARGGVTIRQTTDPLCSYVEVTPQWNVLSAREHDPYTMWSSTGPYWWASGREFLTYAQHASHNGITSIAPVYNDLIAHGQLVTAMPIESFIHLGSPEALKLYEPILSSLQQC